MKILSILREHTLAEIANSLYENRMIFAMLSMHWIMFVSPMLITLLSNDLSILVLVSLFLYAILTINVIFQDCPISIIEDKYLGNSMIDTVSGHIHRNYESEQRANTTSQWLFMGIVITNAKIFLLLLRHCFFTYLSE